MRILYLLPTVQHPAMRGGLRHYHLLRALARRHPVTVLALARAEIAVEALNELRQCADRVLLVDAAAPGRPGTGTGVSGLRWRVAKHRRFRRALDEMKEKLGRIVRSETFDVVLFHGMDIHPVIDRFDALPIVLDMCDATSLRLRHGLRHVNPVELPWRLFRYWQVRRAEATLCDTTPHLAFISGRDRQAILGPQSRATVVPNGVDLAYWTRQGGERRANSVIFTGVMDYPPNVDAARYLIRRIAPRIRHSVPDLEVVIAGRSPVAALVREARTQPGVRLTGYVDDLRPYLERAAVFVAPLRYASGMQNKILEAMAMELPVVTTPIAADGLRVQHEREPPVRVAERADDLAAHVVRLLGDAAASQTLGTLGREFVQRHFDWERSADTLEQMCLEAVSQRMAAVTQSASDRAQPERVPAG